MAEARHCFGRGAYDFTLKIYNRRLLGTSYRRGTGTVRASSLSAGFLLGANENEQLYGAENPADRVTGGAARGSYTRATPVLRAVNDSELEGNVIEYYYYRGRKEYSLDNKIHVRIIERNFSRCRINAKFRRPFGALCRGTGPLVFIRDYSGNGARSEPLYKTKTGYYDVLQVSSTATQAQIKTAYYKQSFAYHPDRNANSDEATSRFSEISEAYTVLGNKALRKKYDRGLLSQSDLTATVRPSSKDDTGGTATQQTQSRRSVMGMDSRGSVFDFDKFIKSHYSEQLQKERDFRVRKERMLRDKGELMGEKKLGLVVELCLGLMLVVSAGIMFSLKRS